MSAETPRQPVMVRCGDCSHTWPIVYLPMEADKATRVMRAHASYCPMCAAPAKRIFMAPDAAPEAAHAQPG